MRELPLYLAFRALAVAIGVLPEAAARRLGEGLGWLASFAAPGRLRLVERHLLRVTGEGAGLRRRARRAFASYGRYWAEVFWVRPQRKATIVAHTDVDHVERLHAASKAGRGVIVALPHIGNWEAAGARSEAEGIPVLAAAEALANERLVRWFVAVRAAMGIDVAIAGRGNRVTARLAGRLREGGAVALLADRDLSGRGIEVEFFGETTTLPAGPVALADRTGAALLPVGSYFKPGRGHRFVINEPVEIPDLADRAERVAAGTQRFAHALEAIIREAPEQWHLFQPNWPSDRAVERSR